MKTNSVEKEKHNSVIGRQTGDFKVISVCNGKNKSKSFNCQCVYCGQIKEYSYFSIYNSPHCNCHEEQVSSYGYKQIGNDYALYIPYKDIFMEVLIDAEAYSKISKYNWRILFRDDKPKGIVTTIDQKLISMGSVVLGVYTSVDSDYRIISLNKNPLDNRKSNLALVTTSDQAAYRRISKSNISGHKGVCRRNSVTNPWQAYIKVNSERIHLGCFPTYEEAVAAREQAEQKYFKYKYVEEN